MLVEDEKIQRIFFCIHLSVYLFFRFPLMYHLYSSPTFDLDWILGLLLLWGQCVMKLVKTCGRNTAFLG